MEKRIRVTVTIGENEVTIAGPEQFVREETRRLTATIGGPRDKTTKGESSQSATDDLPASERQFIASKKPRGHSEIVTVLGYYLAKNGQVEFAPEDIKRAYARAGVRPPKVMAQALRDAKNGYDFLVVGSKKGTFRLSPHGERTIQFDLPRKEEKVR